MLKAFTSLRLKLRLRLNELFLIIVLNNFKIKIFIYFYYFSFIFYSTQEINNSLSSSISLVVNKMYDYVELINLIPELSQQ